MDLILAIPMFLRLLWLFIVGACIGSFINVCVLRVPERQNVALGGSKCRSCGAAIRWFDNIPVFSWLRLRGKCRNCQESISWQYPIVELLTGAMYAGLYWWEVAQEGLIPAAGPVGGAPVIFPAGVTVDWVVHALYLSHVVLVTFMLAGAVIDLRLQIIPDPFTLPAALIALILAAVTPWALLPHVPLRFPGEPLATLEPLLLTHDSLIWPAWLNGAPSSDSLAIALGCFVAWWAALLNWQWRTRRGQAIALAILLRKLRKDYVFHAIVLSGSLLICAAWQWLPDDHWAALLSALVGMAWGGGYTWLIRIISGLSLGKEALGFGDVILMSMFGAFLGWQGVTIVFFVAPFFGIVGAMLQLFVARDQHIPYGPSLCLGAMTVIIWWVPLWDAGRASFVVFGWLLPGLLLGSTVLLAVMLVMYRGLKAVAGFSDYDEEDDEDEADEKDEEKSDGEDSESK